MAKGNNSNARAKRRLGSVKGKYWKNIRNRVGAEGLQAGAGVHIPVFDRLVHRPGFEAAAVVGEYH